MNEIFTINHYWMIYKMIYTFKLYFNILVNIKYVMTNQKFIFKLMSHKHKLNFLLIMNEGIIHRNFIRTADTYYF